MRCDALTPILVCVKALGLTILPIIVRLNCPFCRTGALLQPDTGPRVELLANLLYLYDESWRLEGGRIVVGNTARSAQPSGDQEGGLAKPMKKLKKWLALAELGHLARGEVTAMKTAMH